MRWWASLPRLGHPGFTAIFIPQPVWQVCQLWQRKWCWFWCRCWFAFWRVVLEQSLFGSNVDAKWSVSDAHRPAATVCNACQLFREWICRGLTECWAATRQPVRLKLTLGWLVLRLLHFPIAVMKSNNCLRFAKQQMHCLLIVIELAIVCLLIFSKHFFIN